jgi:triacylglycerol lipase
MYGTRRVRSAVLVALASLGLATGGGAQASAAPAAGAALDPARPLVVVVHGMGRTSRSMRPVVRALEAEGYDVLNFGYSSYCCSIAELGAQLRAAVDARVTPQHTVVHFVGHSLGNILVRWVLTREEPVPRAGRVVMLAPPNGGSRSADRWAPVVGWLLEPIDELRTDSTSTVRRLPRVRGVDIGVISGVRDGKVRVDETHLAEETEHVVVPGYHSFLMRRDDVLVLTRAFLREGKFGPAPRAEPAP